MTSVLKAVHCEGVRPDSLGDYLVGPGLLAAVTTKWPDVRSCWLGSHFVLLAAGIDREALEAYLSEDWKPTAYERWWAAKQKADTKRKSDRQVWEARSTTEIGKVRILDSHIVGVARNQFNPLFGTGGNIGKRDLAKLQKDAQALLGPDDDGRKANWLRATLFAERNTTLPPLEAAGTWFVYANKTFNSGQDWYREGRLSPWSFLIALEGALLLVGGAGRRLAAQARSYAVFPFISDASSPTSAAEVGLVKGEFWAPIWEHPANLTEVRALFERGLARIGQRAATAPHEFALAARAAGVDAGVSRFVRFVLRHTTSSQVYEAIPQERITVSHEPSLESRLLAPLPPWLQRLPYEPRDAKQKGKFKGLRGAVERIIIRITERPEQAELWRDLLLLLAETQGQIDRNKELRGRCSALPPLDSRWFDSAWPQPTPEIVLAKAIASVGAGSEAPVLVNIYGVEYGKRAFKFPKERPQRTVWHTGHPATLLADVLERRLVDAGAADELPLGGRCKCPVGTVASFLDGHIDYETVCRWIPPLTLLNWSKVKVSSTEACDTTEPTGTYQLHALFRPIFHPEQVFFERKNLFPAHLKPRAVTARRLLSLIRQEQWEEAVSFAGGRYLAAGHSTIHLPDGIRANGDTLGAAMLIPIDSREVAAGLRRWLLPKKKSQALP